MRTVLVPARAGVFSAVGLLISPEQREVVRTWPTPGAGLRGLAEARAALAAEAGTLLPGGDVESWIDCRYAGQSHELRVRETTRLRRRARATQRLRAPRRTDRGRRAAGPGDATRAAVESTICRRSRARGSSVPRSSPRPTARCGSLRVGPPNRPRPARGWCDAREPGRAADPRVALDVDRRRDGHGVAQSRVQPQHQGAGRLLGRALHRLRRAAGPGRAHPRAPGLDARVGRGGDRHRSPGADGAQRPVRGRYPPQRHHHGGAGRDRRPARGVGGQPCPPRRRRWQRARFDAPRRARPSTRRDCACHRRCSTTRCWRASSLRRARPPNAAGISTRNSAPTSSGSPASQSWRRSTAWPRSSTTASVGCAPRSPRCPTDVGRSPTCSTPRDLVPDSSRRRRSWSPSPSRTTR